MAEKSRRENPRATQLLEFLKAAYIQDDEVERVPLDRCGWRSLVQVAKGTGLPANSFFGKKPGEVSEDIQKLIKQHLIDVRYFKGERGRGGEVARFRIVNPRQAPVIDTPREKTVTNNSADQEKKVAPPDLGRRLGVIVFTDIVGYTSLTQRNESLALEQLGVQRELIRAVLPRHGGLEIKTMGDGTLLEFGSALQAVRCAFEIQQALHERDETKGSESKISLRIGVHLGDIIHEDGDVYGDAVNIASRIEPLASPGGVCLSQQVYDQIRNKFEFPIRAIGKQHLKNVDEELEVYRIIFPWETKEDIEVSVDSTRIAVLPFSNISPDPNDGYFADGMTEELISTISRIPNLRVIARTSVMSYKDTKKTIKEIGKDLQVGTIIEGSVRKASNKIRVTFQLIDVKTEEHLWSESYNEEISDVFKIQTEIAERVAKALKIRYAPNSLQIRKPTENATAYSFYLKGLLSGADRSRNGLEEANDYFRKAIALDPSFAKAYAGLSECYGLLAYYSYLAPADAYPRMKSIALQAIDLDNGSAEAHTSLGIELMVYEWDFKQSELELKLAIELNPSHSRAHHIYGLLLWVVGRMEEAVEQMELAAKLDPLADLANTMNGAFHIHAGDEGRGYQEMLDVHKRNPSYALTAAWLALCSLERGEADQSVEYVGKLLELSRAGFSLAVAAIIYGRLGRTEDASKLIDEIKSNVGEPQVHQDLSWAYCGQEDPKNALEELEKAIELRSIRIEHLRNRFVYGRVQSDSRFQELLRRIGM